MTKKEMELASQFGEFLKNAPKKDKKVLSVKEETNKILSSNNITKFGNAVLEFCKKTGVDPSVGVPFDVVTYFSTDNNSFKLPEFVMYTQFNM